MLLSEAIEALCLATRADGRSPRTVEAYRQKLRPLLNYLGDVPIEAITVEDLRRYIAYLFDRVTLYENHPYHDVREGKLSPHTIAGWVRALKRLFNWLEKEGTIAVNPTRRVRTPRPKTELKAASMEDFTALLSTTQGNTMADLRDRAILLLLADTGCRVGGLCNLRVGDADLDNLLVLLTEKGGKPRLQPISPITAEALHAWLMVHPQGEDWLFVGLGTSRKGRLSPGGVGQMLRRRAQLANVKGPVNPHAFRHLFAREYLLAGGDLGTLADLLGHSDIAVTKASYAIFTVGELRAMHARYSPIAQMEGYDDGRAGDS